MSQPQKLPPLSVPKKLAFSAAAIVFGLVIAWGAGELVLRILRIPGVEIYQVRFDPVLGWYLPQNHSITYRTADGNLVPRRTNSLGFLDAEHGQDKPAGTYRIGFFGDSFTEAREVPLEQTFFQVAQRALRDRNVECLAFGQCGLGTLHSYLNSQRWTPHFDLDLVVYVFAENDPGDQIREIKRVPYLSYAMLTPEGFALDTSGIPQQSRRDKLYFGTKNFLTGHSLLAATLHRRIQLLRGHGVKTAVTEADLNMATRFTGGGTKNATPNQNDLPSSWPAPLREKAEKLAAAILERWADETRTQGRAFAVLYVPRQGEMDKPTQEQDSWKYWLETTCQSRRIAFIDPTGEFRELLRTGRKVFHGHFTADGHAAFAAAFVKWFRENHPSPGSQREQMLAAGGG